MVLLFKQRHRLLCEVCVACDTPKSGMFFLLSLNTASVQKLKPVEQNTILTIVEIFIFFNPFNLLKSLFAPSFPLELGPPTPLLSEIKAKIIVLRERP